MSNFLLTRHALAAVALALASWTAQAQNTPAAAADRVNARFATWRGPPSEVFRHCALRALYR